MNRNPESQSDHDEDDPRRFAPLFSSLDKDAAPVDPQFLERLATESADVFAKQARRHDQPQAVDPVASPTRDGKPPRRARLIVALATGLTASALLFAWFANRQQSPSTPTETPLVSVQTEEPLVFADVLKQIYAAETMHLQITNDGETADIWAKRPNLLRIDSGSGQYSIYDSHRAYEVDESKNRVESRDGPFPFYGPDGFDPLTLLGPLDPTPPQLDETPTELTEHAGAECHLFRIALSEEDSIEAFVDASTLELRTFEVRLADGNWKADLLALNEPVNEDKFAIGSGLLTEDSRVGKVTDLQGLVTLRPAMQRRFTPIHGETLLKPGDWLRTDARGANAATVQLTGQGRFTLGPGSLVEIVSPHQVRVIHGQLQATPPPDGTFELLAHDQQTVSVQEDQFYRLQEGELQTIEQKPLWLQGFEGSIAHDSIGSLVAQVDGRNVPLTVGYHKVTVDIRDQIARTVIEESFVNHTDSRLEGVFYFPLPQDASISGFGMWIGDELVEADVVEKQRAREIYETILREKRDPGLLEWSGGNLFKARVFPIFAHSEKRIKITYTQVLPLRRDRYRYSYGLQSEMLKQHPLRELNIDVNVHSAVPLKSVQSPTHETRDELTEHSAHVEFSAQEYTPERDFEVVVEVDNRQSDVVVVPHRRGEDGYFMLQLTPPGEGGLWQRNVLPDGEPIELLIVADTSASLDRTTRKAQSEVIAALLASLDDRDKFNLACCDVACNWVFEESYRAIDSAIVTAQEFVDNRRSLGWSDLENTFRSVMERCGPQSHVVYIGDGIVTTQTADPVAFGKSLKRMYAGQAGSFHAVAVGNTFEPLVLRSIASAGSGSVRRVGGEQTPQRVALELFREIAQPAIRDLQVEFSGVRTARVYPDELPNMAAGTQQILLGRYLPEGRDQLGEVIVTGTQDGKPLRFSAPVVLEDAEHGNSFIPRLWARMHLDRLLEQGTSTDIKDEIIALSEEYHIITPYTSLLVLESDADRKRFGVKRRFRMRDGEKFFAEGRDSAQYELVQQQMRRAGNWRLGLRRDVLRQLMGLGRDSGIFQPRQPGMGGGKWAGRGELGRNDFFWSMLESNAKSDYSYSELGESTLQLGDAKQSLLLGLDQELDELAAWDDDRSNLLRDFVVSSEEEEVALELITPALQEVGQSLDGVLVPSEPMSQEFDVSLSRSFRKRADGYSGFEYRMGNALVPGQSMQFGERPLSIQLSGGIALNSRGRRSQAYWQTQQFVQWLDTLFPQLARVPSETTTRESDWPDAARTLVENLLRNTRLAELQGGIQIERQSESFDVLRDRLTSRSRHLEIYSPLTWFTRQTQDGGQTIVNWCDDQQQGVLSEAFQLGRLRDSEPPDLSTPPLALGDYSLSSLEQRYYQYSAMLEVQDDERTVLVLKHPDGNLEVRVLIDTRRNVVLSVKHFSDGKLNYHQQFSQFVEVAGMWWARRIESFDADGKMTGATSQTIQALEPEQVTQQIAEELAQKQQSQFLRMPLVEVAEAKSAVATGQRTFDSQIVLLLHFARSQQWDRVMEHLQQAESLALEKPGMRWIRHAVLLSSRRNEELRQRLLAEADGLSRSLADDRSVHAMFLAQYLVGQAAGILQAHEMLTLLDVLKPIYDAQPEHLQAHLHWSRARANQLQSAGQRDEAFQLWEETARAFPDVYDVQQQYAWQLFNAGERAAAYAWLDRALGENAIWHPHEEHSLQNAYVQMLQQQGRFDDMVERLTPWLQRIPPNQSLYGYYLSALVRSGQDERANELIASWIRQARDAETLTSAAAARLQAAVNQALGQGHNLHTNRIEPRWLPTLVETVEHFASHPTHGHVANQIMSHGQFQRTDECRRLRANFAKILVEQIESLSVAQIDHLINWITPDDPAVETPVWQQIVAGLQQRWQDEDPIDQKDRLSQILVRVLTAKLGSDELLAFLRKQLSEGPQEHRTRYANQLFERLLQQAWSAEIEDEAFGLLTRMSDSQEPAQRLWNQVHHLYRLTDRMVAARHQAGVQQIEQPEKLTRTELRELQAEKLKLAREGFTDRLATEQTRQAAEFARWIHAERLFLEVKLQRGLDQVEQECWDQLGPRPTPSDDPLDSAGQLQHALLHRHLMTLCNLAARRGAQPTLIERLLRYLDDGIQTEPDEEYWKLAKYRLLIALDRPRDLEADLRTWIPADVAAGGNMWRLSLGYLLAEQGKIAEAIQLLEAVQAADELGPKDYRTLADWYLVTDRREQRRQALTAMFMTMPEGHLGNYLSQHVNRWQQTGTLPSELDPEVLLVFQALFHKSQRPQNYVWQLQRLYQACRDFRLLAGLADAVVGQSATKVYPYLQNLQTVLGEIRDEATADSLVERIAQTREQAQSTVDRRALDMLEMRVERRSSELLNQPGPHAARALAAMRRAFTGEWAAGEPRLMAELLASLGRMSQQPLVNEQLTQFEQLHRQSEIGSIDRLHIAHAWSRTLWAYLRRDDAIDRLQSAIDEYAETADGRLPSHTNELVTTLVSYHEQQGHFVQAENVLLRGLARPANHQQARFLKARLYECYEHALRADAEVSLGTGVALYQELQRRIIADLATSDHNHRYTLVARICSLYRTAQEARKLPMVTRDLRAFAFEHLDTVLERQTNNYTNVVSTVAETLHDLAGPRDGLEFLIRRIESEPAWFRINNQDGWKQHAWRLGRWRAEAKQLGDLEPRLLAIVLHELRSDLESQQQRNRDTYHRQDGHFWQSKQDDFYKTAEAVWEDRKESGAAVVHIADYLYWGLARHDRAIEIMLLAHADEILDESGRSKLVDLMHRQERFGESIAILQPLVELRPDNLQYRTWLMRAFYRTSRNAELLALLKATDAHFHAGGRWTENVIASLAAGCLDNQLYAQSAAYYEELIPLHQRTQPNRGIGNGTLSQYYASLARAYSGLKNTAKAVEAASGAVVSWGPRHDNRAGALRALRLVLAEAGDLDQYVVHLDEQTEQTGLHNPIVRKAIGEVYKDKQQFPKAIAQLRLALDVQPNDAETHQALIACYDELKDKQGAVRQLFESVQLNRRAIEQYKDLGRRLGDDKQASERAYTSIVEMLPNESESHAMLAEIRQQQQRWPEAIEHWKQVSEIRALEPTGLLGLAAAQIHERRWSPAAATLKKLKTQSWPARFSDVDQRVRELEQQLESR